MSSPIALELFNFIDEFARDVRAGEITADQTVTSDDTIVIFGEAFFDQFFANVLKSPIEQFSATSKREAGRLAEELRSEQGATAASRALIALFEDGYHGWLCAEALTHARAAEKVTSLYFNALSRGEDNRRALTDFRAELRFHRFGLYLNIRAFRPRDLLIARPRVFYAALYPVLIALAAAMLALVAAGVIGAAGSAGEASAASLAAGTKGANRAGSPAVRSSGPR